MGGVGGSQILRRTVNLRSMVAAGSASAKRSRAVGMLALALREKGCGKLTLCGVEHDQDIVVLAGILDLIKTNKASLDASPARQAALRLLHLALAAALVDRQCELGVHQLDAVLAAAVLLFECVHAREAEVHSVSVREVLEEGEQLDYVVLVHNLQADGVGCPLLVDWDYHAAAGDGERACNSDLVSTASEWFHEGRRGIRTHRI